MFSWNTDEKEFKNLHPREYRIWRITQLINYGLEGEKLDVRELKEVWPEIKNRVSPDRRKLLEFYLWNQKWHKETGLAFDRSNFWAWYSKLRKS